MTWLAITNYLAANWLELAGTVTTVLGIWLTTRRLLICWPVVLAADFLYLAVFFRARLFSDALAAGLLCGLYALRLVALVAWRAD